MEIKRIGLQPSGKGPVDWMEEVSAERCQAGAGKGEMTRNRRRIDS